MRSGSGIDRCAWICRYMLLTCAHISDEIVSRTDRAFSRARRKHDAMELGFSVSYARYSITRACVATPKRSLNSSASPVVSMSGCHWCAGASGRSICRFRLTPM